MNFYGKLLTFVCFSGAIKQEILCFNESSLSRLNLKDSQKSRLRQKLSLDSTSQAMSAKLGRLIQLGQLFQFNFHSHSDTFFLFRRVGFWEI